MTLEEKFWDAAITEAAKDRRPPDQAHEILLRLQNPELDAQPKARVFKLRRVLELAAAAAVLLGIGVLTGLIPLWREQHVEDPKAIPREVAAAPGADYEFKNGIIELRGGWLLVSTGAPPVHAAGSTLTEVDGRVLVHAGDIPTPGQVEAIADWLNANQLEGTMITDIKRWAQGLTLAALVLTGQAMLDGRLVEAQEEVKPAEPTWHLVRTVMDIEKLPADATHVRGVALNGAHLEFLADHPSIEALEARNCTQLRPEQLRALGKLPKLKFLDMLTAAWQESADYRGLMELEPLEELTIDYAPGIMGKNFGEFGDWEDKFYVLHALSSLSDRGVKLSLGALREINSEQLGHIADQLLTVTELNLNGNEKVTNADMKVLAEHPKLEALRISSCTGISELGLAYFAKANRLTYLQTTVRLDESARYQLQKMTKLETLDLPQAIANWAEPGMDVTKARLQRLPQVLADISRMSGLRNLRINLGEFEVESFEKWEPSKALTELALLGYERETMEKLVKGLVVAAQLKVETLTVSSMHDDVFVTGEDWLKESAHKALHDRLGGDRLKTLILSSYSVGSSIDAGEPGLLPKVLATQKGLKRIEIQPNRQVVRDYAAAQLAGYEVVFN